MRDVAALDSKTVEISYKTPDGLKRVPWIETLTLTSDLTLRSIEDTVKLEKAFHDASLLAVKEGYRRLAALHVPAVRPSDFLAETLRDDRTMQKVKQRLADEASRIKAVEDRKRVQAEKKFTKKGANKNQAKKKPFVQTKEDDDLKNIKTLQERKPTTGKPTTGKRTGKPTGKPSGKHQGKPQGKPYGKPQGKSGGKPQGKPGGKPQGKFGGKSGGKGVQKSLFKKSSKGSSGKGSSGKRK